MIIQRFAAAIRRQDWIQVIVEVGIVVLGIFIGLQVDDWNTARQERAEGEVYLDRLYQDLEYDVTHFTSIHLEVVNKQLQLEELANIVKTDDLNRKYYYLREDGSKTDVDFYSSLESSVQFGWSFPPVRTTTFQDLQNSGNLSLIEGGNLRYAISFYYEEAHIIRDRILARISGYSQAVYGMIEQGPRTIFAGEFERIGFDLILPTLASELAIRDFIEKADNPDFSRLLNAELNYSGFILKQIEQQLKLTKQLLTQIDETRSP